MIGDILACPKCGSMVQIVPPVDWKRSSSAETAPIALVLAPASPAPTPTKAAASVPPALPPRPTAQPAPFAESAVASNAMVAAAPTSRAAAAGAIWTAALARVKQDWLLLSGGLGGGVLLGTAIWFAVGSQAPPVQVVADATPRSAATPLAGNIAEPSDPAAPPKTEQSAPAAVEPTATEPRSSSAPPLVVEPNEEPTAEKPAASASVSSDDPEQPVAEPTAVARPVDAKAPSGPAIKLDPVPATKPDAADADSEPDPRSAADGDAPAEADPMPRDATLANRESAGLSRRLLSPAEIDARLSRMLTTVDFTKVPLAQFAQFIGDFTGLSVVIDQAALEKVGKSRRTPLTVKLADVSASDALRKAVTPLGLSCAVREGNIVITAAKDRRDSK